VDSRLPIRVVLTAVAAALLSAGCADAPRGGQESPTLRGPGLPSALATQPPATVLPSAPRAAAPDTAGGCDTDRVRALIDGYVDAYNAADWDALRGLFDVEHRFFEYFDAVQGSTTHVRGAQEAAPWERHIRERFAAGERLALVAIQHYDGYADVRLSRTAGTAGRGAVPLTGSAKIVCDGGRIIRAVMTAS